MSRLKERAARVAAGLCTNCGRNKPKEGRRLCEACADRERMWKRKWAKARREAGFCTACGKEPTEPGYLVCQTCRERNSANKKALRQAKRGSLCSICGKYPPRDGMKTCFHCFAKAKVLRDDRVTDGVCVSCGKNWTYGKSVYCAECLLKHREHHRRWLLKRRMERRGADGGRVGMEER